MLRAPFKTGPGPKKGSFAICGEVALIAVCVAVVMTVCAWLIIPEASSPDGAPGPAHQDNPFMLAFALANFPAAVLSMNLFGMHPSTKELLPCIFLQWFVLGAGLGILREIRRRNREQA